MLAPYPSVESSLANSESEAEIQAEIMLGALDGLAFRWSLDTDFAFVAAEGPLVLFDLP